jgi:hypothetical protein
MASMTEVPEERLLERFPMFQRKVRKVLVKTIDDHIHDVQPLLQLLDPLFAVTLLEVQERLVMTSLLPDMVGGIVFPKELLCHLVVLSDGGRGVVQVLFDIVGGGNLIRGGRDEGGGGDVERHSSRSWL